MSKQFNPIVPMTMHTPQSAYNAGEGRQQVMITGDSIFSISLQEPTNTPSNSCCEYCCQGCIIGVSSVCACILIPLGAVAACVKHHINCILYCGTGCCCCHCGSCDIDLCSELLHSTKMALYIDTLCCCFNCCCTADYQPETPKSSSIRPE